MPLGSAQRRALARLKGSGALDGLYLAGGGAVAHHLHHRRSNDLDLFSVDPELDLEPIRRVVVAQLGAQVVADTEVTLKLKVGAAMVDVVRYPYAMLARLSAGPEGVRVAGLRDLAPMKLSAIARRGVRRDYWDLYEILTRTRITLHTACDDYVRKFGVSESDLYHVLRALSWFDAAERDPRPRGLTRAKWNEIRTFLEHHAGRELLRRTR